MHSLFMSRQGIRFLLFGGMALLASGVFLPEVLGQFGRPPGFPNVPQQPRPNIPSPPRFNPLPSPLDKVWFCSNCKAELGRGPAQPLHSSCPHCSTRFSNSVSPHMDLPNGVGTSQPNAWNNNNNTGGNFPPASGGSTSPAMANPGIRNPNALVDPNAITPPLQNNYPQVTTPSPSPSENSSSSSSSSGRSMKIFVIIGGVLLLMLIAAVIAGILIMKVLSKGSSKPRGRRR